MQDVIKIILENLLIAGVSALGVIEYFKTFFEKKSRKTDICVIWMLYTIWQFLVTYVMTSRPAWMLMLLSILFVLITSCFFCGDKGGKIVFSILYIAIWMLVESITGCLFLLLDVSIEEYMFIGSVASKVLLLIFVKVLQLFFHNEVVCELSWKTDMILMLLPVGSMFLAYQIFMADYRLEQSGITQSSILSIFIILAINIVVFSIYIRLSENLELKHKNMVYETEFDLLDKHMKEKEEAMLEFRRKRHDLKHQMLGVLQLLDENQYDHLRNRIIELANLKSLEGLKIANTDNSIIDVFVNYKYEAARNNNIEFKVDLNIPSQLPFQNGDLCVILGNVLDNALEANLRSKIDNPYIELVIRYDGENLIIVVENSFDGQLIKDKGGNYLTRKIDNENHGLGISSIKRILDKYHGYYDVETNDHMYHLEIILHDG